MNQGYGSSGNATALSYKARRTAATESKEERAALQMQRAILRIERATPQTPRGVLQMRQRGKQTPFRGKQVEERCPRT